MERLTQWFGFGKGCRAAGIASHLEEKHTAEELVDGTLESRAVPNLWFAGELLNVDGACGGYNLHFAWGSGIRAAKEIAQRAENI